MAVSPDALDFTASKNDDPSKHITKPSLSAMWIYIVGPFTGGLIAGLWNLFVRATEKSAGIGKDLVQEPADIVYPNTSINRGIGQTEPW